MRVSPSGDKNVGLFEEMLGVQVRHTAIRSGNGQIVVTAVVRGSAALDIFSVGGARRFGSGGVQPWVLAEFRNVTGLAVGGEDLPTGPVARIAVGSLPIGLGVVDGELLTWSNSPIEHVERTAERPQAGGAGERSTADGSADAVAFTDKEEIDKSYVRCMKVLMAGKGYPMIATHDARLIDIGGALAVLNERDADTFEYQMLYGIRSAEQRRLAGKGAQVRVYVAYGSEWYEYFMRRLAERPSNLKLFARSLVHRA